MKADYISGYDEETHEEDIDLNCPTCGKSKPIDWSELERGTAHECVHCGYKWQIA